MPSGVIKKRADFVAVLEAMHASEADDTQWARTVAAAVDATLVEAIGAGVNLVAHGNDYADPTVFFAVNADRTIEPAVEQATKILPTLDREWFRVFFYPGKPYVTHHELEHSLPAGICDEIRMRCALTGTRDACGLFAYPAPGIAAVIHWGSMKPDVDATSTERRHFAFLASHFDAAFRLRMQPELAVAAVLAPDGRLLDLEDSGLAPRRAALAERVARIESSRTRAQRITGDSLEHWTALVGGQYTLVPREDRDGRRYYLLVNNPPAARESAVFSPTEVDVVRLAARGFGGKQTAYALGLSEAAVSLGLARAAAKLGLRSRVELIRVAAAMFGPVPTALAVPEFTPAEREVFELIRRGLSNAQIAQLRAASPRTVANQVAALLAKTGSPSRRALAAHAS